MGSEKGGLSGSRALDIVNQARSDAEKDWKAPVLSSIVSGYEYDPGKYSGTERELYEEAYKEALRRIQQGDR